MVVSLIRGTHNKQARHGGDGYTAVDGKAQLLEPFATTPEFGHIFVAVLVKPCFGLNFQTAHIGAPEGLFLFAGSHKQFD